MTIARRASFSPMRACPMNCGRMSDVSLEYTQDAFLGGQLLLRQPKSGHRAGHDTMLLAASCRVRVGERVVAFGAGGGPAGLAVARRFCAVDLTLVEIAAGLAQSPRDNAAAKARPAYCRSMDVTG